MPNIQHALLIEATAEEVYNAIVTQEGLSAWWTPDARTTGALNSVATFHFGASYFKEMEIIELRPHELVKWHCTKGAGEWIGTNISFTLLHGDKETLAHTHPEMSGQLEQLQNDKATLLTFHHDDWKEYTLMFAECNYTWGRFLRSLKLFCETGEGRPWPKQHLIN